MMKKKTILGLVALIAVSVLVVGCGKKATGEDKVEKVKLGVVGENNEVWESVQTKLKDDGIELEIVSFSDYNQPNGALADGSLELNSFQHQIFLDNYNTEHGTNLVAIGDTVIAPLGLYSDNLKSVEALTEGAKISIPNDVTNGGRALLLLQTAGLIKVDPAAESTPTPKDITENNLKLDISELDAAQVARSLKDVDIAVINSGLAVDAGFVPTKDSIFLEPVDDNSKPYINIIVAREEDKDNKTYQKIVKAYQQDDTKKVIEETSKGSSVPAW